MPEDALAFWVCPPGRGVRRPVQVADPGPSEVQVCTTHNAVSRGTEMLVFGGRVPPEQYSAMRAHFQDGEFPGTVTYGYLNVGTGEQVRHDLRGKAVFCLYPLQTAYVVLGRAVAAVPEAVPAGTVETAVSALRDAGHQRSL